MNKRLSLVGVVALVVVLIAACAPNLPPTVEPTTAPTAAPGEELTLDNGLKIQDIVIGTGAEAVVGSQVDVHYLGTLENGTKFDSSYDRGETLPFTVGGGGMIPGFDLGVRGMKVGGKRKITIPPDLAYGAQGAGGVIPPNATITFEVELVNVR